ncbi:THUMP-like domain-containing protein [Seonamhaeicola maritimus]|uniref:Class I SAM-dependent methyltransferase n=1 Tax=Seonamhaeicola maritimus TaxID=2591822 RepID=A0A5C7GMA7_9FLAO|nr:class I SAM-dependent methyltransferase [Seonamhaeicola maritimus]TXG39462.1 class I SAM-dependent methyltransferase [Seonamhaeicola maritimus]
MNLNILNTEIQEFISKHLNSNVVSLLLKGTSFDGVETKDIIEQIEAKQRCLKKLPNWFNTNNIYFPNKLNIEQTSSEITAEYKSNLISGDSIIDLTGGFGIDCYYFSKRFNEVTHCEINTMLSGIVNHNYKQFDVNNIETLNIDGIEYLKSGNKNFDWIYIDPSRRNDSKGKVFFLKDCLPNVPEHLDILFEASKNILIKTSPLLDISFGANELQFVKTIHVIAVNNEVKELLWVLDEGFNGNIQIETINIKKDTDENFSFMLNEGQNEVQYNEPLSYLYEPNAAILKSGGFEEVSNKLNVFKLHQHSHLYTSNEPIDFPGRRFKIENIINYNKKELKQLGIEKANITTRNFPESVQQIRNKLRIKDGGDIYLFFTTDLNNLKIVVICKKA